MTTARQLARGILLPLERMLLRRMEDYENFRRLTEATRPDAKRELEYQRGYAAGYSRAYQLVSWYREHGELPEEEMAWND